MSADNYRIVKKIINYWYRSILGKKLTKCCHMATSGQKGLRNDSACLRTRFVRRNELIEISFPIEFSNI